MSETTQRRSAGSIAVAMALLLSVFGMWSWRDSLRRPVREDLLSDTGIVVAARQTFRRGRNSTLLFTLGESGRRFRYDRYLGSLDRIFQEVRLGARVTVLFSEPDRPEIWELSVDGNTIVDLELTSAGRRRNGRIALAVAVIAGACSVWFAVMFARIK